MTAAPDRLAPWTSRLTRPATAARARIIGRCLAASSARPWLVGRPNSKPSLGRSTAPPRERPIHQLIAGEAGVGKSRLVLAATEMASARGMRVLQGGCADIGDGGVPYGPIVEALRTLARSLDAEELEAVLGSARPELARLVPSLSPAAVVDDSDPDRIAPGPPARRGAGRPPAAVGDRAGPVRHRGSPLGRSGDARDDRLPHPPSAHRPRRAGHDLPCGRAPSPPSAPAVAGRARARRSGRTDRPAAPRTGRDRGAAGGDPRRRRRPAISPTRSIAAPTATRSSSRSCSGPARTPRAVVCRRPSARCCSPGSSRCRNRRRPSIGVVAVAGRRVDHDLLARVAAMDGADLLDALRTAVGSQVLVTGPAADSGEGDYAFRHALLQEAAYDDLLPGERQRLHRAFAEALAERGPGSGAIAAGHWAELAYHWSAARDDRRAFEASIRAGEAAAGRVRLRRRATPGRARPRAVVVGRSAGGRGRVSIASRCSTGPPSRPGCPAIRADRSSCAARRSRRSVPMPTRSGPGRCSNGSDGRCGPTARPRPRSRRTRRPWR